MAADGEIAFGEWRNPRIPHGNGVDRHVDAMVTAAGRVHGDAIDAVLAAPDVQAPKILTPVEVRVDEVVIGVAMTSDRLVEVADVARVGAEIFNKVPCEE